MKLNGKRDDFIKSLEFTPNGINIVYRYDKKTEYLDYAAAESLTTNVFIGTYTHKGSTYAIVSDINIILKTVNGEEININPKGSLNNIYKIIDIKKYFQNFKLEIDGADDFDTCLKIYSKFGVKLPIPRKSSIVGVEVASLLLWGTGAYFFYEFGKSGVSTIEFIAPLLLFFFGVSTILSGILIWQEYSKYKIRKVLGI